MSKKYKIVLSEVDFGSQLSVGLIDTRQKFETAKQLWTQDPKGYEDKYKELETRLRTYNEAVKFIESILNVSAGDAELVFEGMITKYQLGISKFLKFLSVIADVAKPMGLDGPELIEFIKFYLEKSKDLPNITLKITDALKQINSLSMDLKILPQTMLRIFKDGLINNNFKEVYNIIAVAPLLSENLKTVGAKNLTDNNLATKAVSAVESISQIGLDKTAKMGLIDELVESQNKVEFFYNKVLATLDYNEIARVVKFNNSLANDIQINSKFYIDLTDFHNTQSGNLYRLKEVYDAVNKKTMQPPGDKTKIKESTGTKFTKYKIVIAQQNDNENLQNQFLHIEAKYNQLDNNIAILKELKEKIENYLKPSEKLGESIELVTSFVDKSQVKKAIKEFESKLNDSKNLFNLISTQLTSFLSLRLPEQLKIKADAKIQDLQTAKLTAFQTFDIELSRFKMLLPILDDLKSLDDKIALYNQYKENIKPKSAKFRVKFNWVDPATGEVSNAIMPRYSFINWVYNIGLDIVSKISSIANKYMGVSGEAGIRSAVRLNKEALKFKTENQNWAESNMDVQAPLVEEFRK